MQSERGPAQGFGAVHEATALLRAIQQLNEAFTLALGRTLTVNPTDLEAMQHLIMRGPQRPTELARLLGISTAAATTVIDRLSALGHVARMPNPGDRRGVMVAPTDASVERAMAALVPMISGIDRVIHGFDDDDQSVIVEYLRRVVEAYRDSIPGTA